MVWSGEYYETSTAAAASTRRRERVGALHDAARLYKTLFLVNVSSGERQFTLGGGGRRGGGDGDGEGGGLGGGGRRGGGDGGGVPRLALDSAATQPHAQWQARLELLSGGGVGMLAGCACARATSRRLVLVSV